MMKRWFSLLAGVPLLTAVLQAQDTAFTYQGRLLEDGQPATGEYAFEFQLYGDESGDTAWGEPVAIGPVAVSNGLFTVVVDLGWGVAEGAADWLGIQVRTNAVDAPYIPLSPRQRLTSVPRAVVAQQASSAMLAEGVAPGAITGESVVSGTLGAVHLAADEVVKSVNGLHDEVTLAAGTNTLLTTSGSSMAIHSLGWGLRGNAGTDPNTDYVGTSDEAPLELRVNSQRVMRFEADEGGAWVNVVAGHPDNGVGKNDLGESFYGVTISGGGGSGPFSHTVDSDWGTIGGGAEHRISRNSAGAAIGGGMGGSIGEWAYDSVIAGGRAQSIMDNAFRSTIGGGSDNTIGAAAYYSTLSGGWTNRVLAYYSTIAGGLENVIGVGAQYSSIGGGSSNRVEGSTTATIAGGAYHKILSDSRRSTITGGASNRVEQFSSHATVGGGLANVVGSNSEGAVIPGGVSNRVDGVYAMAAGRLAHAAHPGALVWADSAPYTFASEADDEVALRARGGMRVVTAVDKAGNPTAGVTLAAGSGSWASLSDRSSKSGFTSVDPVEILEKVVRLPVEHWRYRTEADDIRHVGPMAQDFHRIFEVGADARAITSVDADGVALAAIQGLYALVQEQRAEIQQLRAEVEALTTRRRSPPPVAETSADRVAGQTPEQRSP